MDDSLSAPVIIKAALYWWDSSLAWNESLYNGSYITSL